jgi:hypothetical protein
MTAKEVIAAAIYDAENGLDGDPIADMLLNDLVIIYLTNQPLA